MTAPWRRPQIAAPRAAFLTRRQVDVLTGIVHGDSNAEIADRLGVCETTVKTTAGRAMRALRARNRAHAAALAMSGQVTIYVRDARQERRAA